MASKAIEIPAEVSTSMMRGAANASIGVLKFGGNTLLHMRPGYIPPEIEARQAVLKDFEHHVGIVGNLMEPGTSARELDARIDSTAHAMVEKGVVDEHSTVELRPILSEDALRGKLSERRVEVVRKLGETLTDEYDVAAIPSIHPIIPVEHEGTPADPRTAWGAIATELDGLAHQHEDEPKGHLAMLAIAGPGDIDRFFGHSTDPGGYGYTPGDFRVLDHVGTRPEDNVLIADRGIRPSLTPVPAG